MILGDVSYVGMSLVFTLGNAVTVITSVVGIVGLYFTLKNKVNNLEEKRLETRDDLRTLHTKVEVLDKEGSFSFKEYKANSDKNNEGIRAKLEKIDDLMIQVAGMSKDIAFIKDYIEHQGKN